MPFVAATIAISETVKTLLTEFSKSRTLPLYLIQRATIVLKASEGFSNTKIADDVKLERHAIGRWRARFADALPHLHEVESEAPESLRDEIVSLLSDLPRPGTPPKYNPIQIVQIMEVACKSPREYGYESNFWNLTQLAQAVVKDKIVETIPKQTLWNFLKGGGHSSQSHQAVAELPRKA